VDDAGRRGTGAVGTLVRQGLAVSHDPDEGARPLSRAMPPDRCILPGRPAHHGHDAGQPTRHLTAGTPTAARGRPIPATPGGCSPARRPAACTRLAPTPAGRGPVHGAGRRSRRDTRLAGAWSRMARGRIRPAADRVGTGCRAPV